MSSNLASLIILIFSFLGLVFFVAKKMPVLADLVLEKTNSDEKGLLAKLKNKVRNTPGIKDFSLELFLQKIISQIRILSLKTDHKTANWLKNLREKTQKKKLENGAYWQDLKNLKDKK
jgi:hypothetical protein